MPDSPAGHEARLNALEANYAELVRRDEVLAERVRENREREHEEYTEIRKDMADMGNSIHTAITAVSDTVNTRLWQVGGSVIGAVVIAAVLQTVGGG